MTDCYTLTVQCSLFTAVSSAVKYCFVDWSFTTTQIAFYNCTIWFYNCTFVDQLHNKICSATPNVEPSPTSNHSHVKLSQVAGYTHPYSQHRLAKVGLYSLCIDVFIFTEAYGIRKRHLGQHKMTLSPLKYCPSHEVLTLHTLLKKVIRIERSPQWMSTLPFFLFFSEIATVNKESFENAWIAVLIRIQKPWIWIVIRIATKI